ncbi:uncharacterized protein Dana_GF26605 [Drosophila ananassae]|uniref:F-box domain-containing protein n=1 Tax=Drosophila ananassae TaxID=7217 RepID=A0A0P8YBK1_DROAN|nr:uncharacterized protein LOC26514014 [Drosophila ananassae]KPU78775.1 uncharacterized protein Dana_GF26605 [Drosophila ananassae]
MSSKNLIDLCDDSLYYIFDFLPTEDRISLAQVSQRFRNVFVDKYGSKYSEYTLIAASPRQELIQFCICCKMVKSLTIDLDHFDTNKYFRNYGFIAPKNSFQILCHSLAGMVRLEHLSIKQLKDLVTPIKRLFYQILDPIRQLSDLKSLQIVARDDCVLNHLSQLQYLESLTLLVPKVPVATLVKCCKYNTNLKVLHLGYSCVQGSIGDIVPHCKELEVLKFGMTAEASTYKPLARLPRLRELYHFGIRRSGSFEPLLSDLATHSQLTHLSIDGGSLTLSEASQLPRIRSLTHLKCFFFTTESLELIADLVNLEELCVWMSCAVDVTNSLLKIIASCKNLKLLRLAAGKVQPNFFQEAIVLIKKEKGAETLHPILKLEVPNYINKQDITQEACNNLYYPFPIGRELIKWNTFNND